MPLPLAPAVIVIQLTLLAAVHEQPVPAVIVTLPVLAVSATVAEVGATVKVQGAPLCVIVTVWPAMVMVPVRDVVDVFAATE